VRLEWKGKYIREKGVECIRWLIHKAIGKRQAKKRKKAYHILGSKTRLLRKNERGRGTARE